MFLFNDGISIKLRNVQTRSASINNWQAQGSLAPVQGWRNPGIYYTWFFFFFSCLYIILWNADLPALFLHLKSYFRGSCYSIPESSHSHTVLLTWFFCFYLNIFPSSVSFYFFLKSLSILSFWPRRIKRKESPFTLVNWAIGFRITYNSPPINPSLEMISIKTTI